MGSGRTRRLFMLTFAIVNGRAAAGQRVRFPSGSRILAFDPGEDRVLDRRVEQLDLDAAEIGGIEVADDDAAVLTVLRADLTKACLQQLVPPRDGVLVEDRDVMQTLPVVGAVDAVAHRL